MTRAALVSFGLTLVALAVSIYLTVEHYTSSTSLACPDTGAISCAKVTTSSWSMVGPIPLALLGAIFFLGMAVLCSPPLWRYRRLDPVRIAGAAGAVATALYLVWVEFFRVEAVCLWCTVVHVASVALLVSVLWTTTGRADEG